MIGLTNSTLFARTLTGRIGQVQAGDGRASTGLAFSNLMLAAADTGTVSDALPAAGVLPMSAKLDDDRGFWIRGYGVSGSLSGDGNAAGTDYHMAGTAAGVDRLINNRLLLGASAGYIRTSASLNGLSDSTTVQSYQAGAYGSYAEGPWTLKAILRYAYNSYDTTRAITIGSLNRTATGDYGGHEGSLYTESAYSFTRGNTTLQPLASLQYVYLRQNSFTEQGAGSLNLSVDQTITESLRSLLGPRLSHVFELTKDRTIKVEGRALWSHEWSDTNSSITTRFAGAPAGGDFTVAGVTVGRDGAVLGAGAMATFSSVFSAFTDYNAEVRNRQTEHQFVGGFRWTW
jgi:outer membrane autotransporter protein